LRHWYLLKPLAVVRVQPVVVVAVVAHMPNLQLLLD
jgi:hypothetical protein